MELLKTLRANWDRTGAWAAIGLGAVALVAGWSGVSETVYVFEQLPYVVSGGVGGLFLLGLGVTLLLSADLRDEWRKLDSIDQHLAGLSQIKEVLEASSASVPAAESGNRPAGSSSNGRASGGRAAKSTQ